MIHVFLCSTQIILQIRKRQTRACAVRGEQAMKQYLRLPCRILICQDDKTRVVGEPTLHGRGIFSVIIFLIDLFLIYKFTVSVCELPFFLGEI